MYVERLNQLLGNIFTRTAFNAMTRHEMRDFAILEQHK